MLHFVGSIEHSRHISSDVCARISGEAVQNCRRVDPIALLNRVKLGYGDRGWESWSEYRRRDGRGCFGFDMTGNWIQQVMSIIKMIPDAVLRNRRLGRYVESEDAMSVWRF